MIGEYLKKCRERSGLDLEAIARKTRIRQDHLRDIESGDFERFPGDVYVRSYIRQYLEALSLDPSEGLSIYNRMLQKNDEATPPADESISRTPPDEKPAHGKIIYAALLAVVLAAIGVFYLISDGGRDREAKPAAEVMMKPAEAPRQPPPPEQVKKPAEAAKDAPLPVLASPADKDAKPGGKPDAVAEAGKKPDAKPVEDAKSAETRKQEEAQKPVPNPAEEPRRPKKYTLAIKASEETWISAQLDDKEHHSELLQPGKSVVLGADEKIILKVGNAGGVSVSLNNQDLGRLGESGQVVILTLPKPE